MLDNLAQRAVEEALKGNWKSAAAINEQILDEDEKNREALNRLARAYLELGKLPKAVTTYKKVLKVDPYNAIAEKALVRLENLKENGNQKNGGSHSSPQILAGSLFIEEPGKTKSVTLIHLGAPNIVSALDAGQEVFLEPHAHRVSVCDEHKEFIGRLPDDLSTRLIKLIKLGNEYRVHVRTVLPDCIKVFIRESKRCEALKDTPSFPINERLGYSSFTPPDSIHDERPDVSTTESDDLE